MQDQTDNEQDDLSPEVKDAIARLTEHIFGKGEKGIVSQLKGSDNIAREIGTIALTMAQEAKTQADQAGVMVDPEDLTVIGAYLIESLLELAEAYGLIDAGQMDSVREDAMGAAIEAYTMTAEGEASPEEQEAAKQQLEMMRQQGMVDEAAGVFSRMGQRAGQDPFAEEGGSIDSQEQAPQPASVQGKQPPA